jgi:chemotaxis protein CheY-P-specific phosphatase CheC
MENANKHIFFEVVSEILEQFAFVFLEEEIFPLDSPEDERPLRANISFSSPKRSGQLILAASRSFCSEVARNVLGVDEKGHLPHNAQQNALQEVSNIACGNLLGRLYGTEEMFELSVPECRYISQEEWRDMAHQEGTISLTAEEEPLLARLEVEEG